MSRKNIPALSRGAIQNMVGSTLYSDTPILQVLGSKSIHQEGSNPAGGTDRYRILLSDGVYSYAYGMLATQHNHLITKGELEAFTIIRVNKVIVNKINKPGGATSKEVKKIVILLDLDVLVPGIEVGERIGAPTPLNDLGEVQDDGAGATVPKATPMGTNNAHNVNVPRPSNNQGYGQQPEKSEVVTHPIISLTPYQNKWTIKVRVTNKSDIRTWSNAKGEGKLFSMNLMDESGEIRATAFTAECDKFYHMIEPNQLYYISSASLKTANKQYSNVKNDYEMTFTSSTTVVPCHEESSTIPKISYDFVAINEITNLDKDTLIDVIGVAKSASEVSTITSKTTNKELRKREVHLVDSSSTEIHLTLWGKAAEDFDAGSQPIVALKGAKISDFGGRTLSTVSSTVMQINPDFPEAHKLRGWYDNTGTSAAVTSISGVRGAGGGGGSNALKTFAEVKLENLGSGEKPDYYSVKAMIAMINKDRALYMACPSSDCNKKVIDQNNGMFRCEKCQRDSQDFKWRMMLSINITDATEQQWVTCFQETAEILLGRSSDELGALKESDNAEFQKIFEEATFKSYIFKLRVKMEMYNDENRLKTNVYEVKSLDNKDYNSRLLKEIKEMMAAEGGMH